jgi:hypothetical protein
MKQDAEAYSSNGIGAGQFNGSSGKYGLRPVTSKKTWNFARFNGKAGKNANKKPTKKC